MPIDATGAPAAFEPAPPAGPRRPSRTMLLGGVGLALGLGLLFGFMARPELAGPREDRPMAARQAVPGAAQLPIAVSPGPPMTAPRSAGRLETLPPEMSSAAQAQVQPRAQPVVRSPVVVETTTTYAPSTAPPLEVAPPQPRAQASFDCASARFGAEQMVCSDAGLASADRRMARAYQRAMRSGVDPQALRQEQRDWTAIREDAAHHSPRAVASVYDQRIRELNQIADEAPADDEEE